MCKKTVLKFIQKNGQAQEMGVGLWNDSGVMSPYGANRECTMAGAPERKVAARTGNSLLRRQVRKHLHFKEETKCCLSISMTSLKFSIR